MTIPRLLLAILIAVISAGWLLPLYFAVHCYLQLQRFTSSDLAMNSFPFEAAMHSSLQVTFIWLAIVLFGWALAAFAPARMRQVKVA